MRQACLCTPADAGFFVFGLREIHQIHLNVGLMFSTIERKNDITVFSLFLCLLWFRLLGIRKEKCSKVVWISMTVWGRVKC